MNFYIKNSVFTSGIFCVFIGFFILTPNVQANDRTNIIDREMDCIAQHSKDGDLTWDDVCYSSSNSRERTIAKAMDQVVKEHEAMSEEMLNDNASVDDMGTAKPADNLYEQDADDSEAASADTTDDQEQTESQDSLKAGSIEQVYKQEADYYGTTSGDYSDNKDNEQDQSSSYYDNNSNFSEDLDDPLYSKKHEFDFGREDFYYRYEEDIPITISGFMHGYYVNYAYRPEEGNILNNEIVNMYKFEGRYASGEVDYKGSGTIKDTTDKMYELRTIIGKDYLLADNSQVTPYVGFGYRYLIDRLGGTTSSTGQYGYHRESQYFYLPFGCSVNVRAPHDWTVGFNVEYDFFLQGVQKSRLSDLDQFVSPQSDNIRNHQDKGFGLRGSIKLQKNFPTVDVYVEPFIHYWNIQRSNLQGATVAGFYSSEWNEPANNTTEIGSKIGLQF